MSNRAHAWLTRAGYLVAGPGVGMVVTPANRWPERPTCAPASGAGNELPACPSVLPGWGSIAQLCR